MGCEGHQFFGESWGIVGVANIVSFLMMFLSGVFFPIETMPEWLQPVSNVLPLTYFANVPERKYGV
jgi:ABC-type multidrug transport system permease subunit